MTGATDDTGFKGIVGHFDGRGPLYFTADIPDQIRLTRVAIVAAVTASAQLDRAPTVRSDSHLPYAATLPGYRRAR